MKMKISLFLMSLLISSSIKAQVSQEPKFSALYEAEEGPFSPRIILETESSLYFTYFNGPKDLYVGAFNKADMTLHYQQSLPLLDIRAKELIIDWRVNGTSLNYFVLYDILRDNQYVVQAHSFDLLNQKDLGSKEMYRRDYKNSMSKGMIDAYLGNDLSKILLKDQKRDLVEKTLSETLLVFNDAFELEKSIELYKGNGVPKLAFLKPHIDEENNLYFITANSLVFLDAFKNFERYEEKLPLSSIPVGSTVFPISSQIKPGENPIFILGYKANLNRLNYFDFGSVIREQKSNKEREGLIYAEFDPLNQSWAKFILNGKPEGSINMGYYPFVRGSISQTQFYNYLPDDFGAGNDYDNLSAETGTFYAAFSLVLRNQGTTSKEISHFHFDNIVTSFSKEGQLNWVQNVTYLAELDKPVDEIFKIDDYFDFKLLEDKESIYLLMNDMPENKGIDIDDYDELEPVQDYDDIVPVLIRFNKVSGAAERISAINLSEEDLFLNVSSLHKSSTEAGTYYYFISNDDEFKLAHWSMR